MRLTDTIYSVPWFMCIKLVYTVDDSLCIVHTSASHSSPPPHMATNQVSAHSRGQRSDRHGHGSMFLHLYMFLDLDFLTAHNCRTRNIHYCTYILCEVLTCTLSIE